MIFFKHRSALADFRRSNFALSAQVSAVAAKAGASADASYDGGVAVFTLAKGGLKQGDTIKSINGKRVSSKAQIVSYVKSNPNMPRYTVEYIRNGVLMKKTVTPKR